MKTQWHTAVGYLEYAQVFEDDRDMGTGGKFPNVDKAREKTDGLYKTRFYPADEAELEKMQEVLSDPMFQGHPRWHDGDENLGTGKYTILQRKHIDPSGFEDFGGAPEVVTWGSTDEEKNEPWDPNVKLGNGTEVLMKYTTYGDGPSQTVRMVKIGVMDHKEYVKPEFDGMMF
jgi:uncharacterized protein YbaA (DUF1428 family)